MTFAQYLRPKIRFYKQIRIVNFKACQPLINILTEKRFNHINVS